jgi:hypothetical protein
VTCIDDTRLAISNGIFQKFISWIDTFLTGGAMFIIWACLSFSLFILIAGGFVSLHTEPKISILFVMG